MQEVSVTGSLALLQLHSIRKKYRKWVIVGFCVYLKTTTLGKQQCLEENPKNKQATV